MKPGIIFEICIVIFCFICAWICWKPEDTSVKLLSVIEIQTELVSRGYEIVVDGKFGPITENALNSELIRDK